MANLFDNLSSKVLSATQSIAGDAIAKAIPGDGFIAKQARGFLTAQSARLLSNGLFPGAANSQVPGARNISFGGDNDIRVRLALSPGSGDILYRDPQNSVQSPLRSTDGVVWPYTPTINVSYSASYSGASPTHSNYVQQSYNSSSVDQITVVGQFTANTPEEASYLLAVLWFLKSATKSFFGQDQSPSRGTPPPVLRFSGHGPMMFNSLPVVITNHTQDFEPSVDYIEASMPGDIRTVTRVPTSMNINISLAPVISRKRQTDFSLKDYSAGKLIGSPRGIGGTP